MEEVLAGLEALPVARALRGSVYAYPLVNAAHIIGIALLVGAIVPLDLRFLGVTRAVEPDRLARALLPVAITGFVIAATAGALLFITRASEYAASPLFLAKLGTIAAALVNAGLLHLAGWRGRAHLRIAGLASFGLWISAIVLGRLVGYF